MRSGWLILWILSCFILSVRLHSTTLMIAGGTGLFLGVFLKIYAWILLGKVKEQAPAEEVAQAGVPHSYPILLKNTGKTDIQRIKGRVYGKGIRKERKFRKKLLWKGGLPGGQQAISEYVLEFPHCGVYSVTRKYLRVYDPFGLVCGVRRKKLTGFVLVLPAVRPCGAAVALMGGRQDQETTAGELTVDVQPEEVRDIRLYQEGDPIRGVHWNLSARMDELYVRDFEIKKTSRILFRITDSRPKKRSAQEWDAFYEILYAWLDGLLTGQARIRVCWKIRKGTGAPEEAQVWTKEDLPRLFGRLYSHQGQLDGAEADIEPLAGEIVLCLDCSRALSVEGREQITYSLDRYREELDQEVHFG